MKGIPRMGDEFLGVDFGDERLNARLFVMSELLASQPEKPLPAVGGWPETKAAYRFFGNERVEPEQIQSVHRERTVQRMLEAGAQPYFVVIQDSSSLNYSAHSRTIGLGSIGRNRPKTKAAQGLQMHTTLAVTQEGTPLGILHQSFWVRRPKKANYAQLPIEQKESYKWLKGLEATRAAQEQIPTELITVADREADISELIAEALQTNGSFVIRAKTTRRLSDQAYKTLHCHLLEQQACAQRLEVPVVERENISGQRWRSHRESPLYRTAELEVRFSRVFLKPKNAKSKVLEEKPVYAVLVREVETEESKIIQKKIEWLLLTNRPITTYEEALEAIQIYRIRWQIEVYHRILKSGCTVEDCRLGTAERLIRYLSVMAIVAWRLHFMTELAREKPAQSSAGILSESEWKVLWIKAHSHKKRPLPKDPPPLKDMMIEIAKLGGFLARKGDGDPGPLTLWRGIQRLIDLAAGFELARA